MFQTADLRHLFLTHRAEEDAFDPAARHRREFVALLRQERLARRAARLSQLRTWLAGQARRLLARSVPSARP